MGRDELLSCLDAAGKATSGKLLLCVDGINESRPRGYWRHWLGSFAAQVARYENVRLCVSCRSTYVPIAVPDGNGLERVEHVGFAGMEFTACRQFFAHHELEPPVAPSFHPEFSNPLFLRLACETLKATGAKRMPSGWHGISTALHAFLREKNKAFAREHERDERERVPQKALQEFMTEVERVRQVYLPWSDAVSVIGRATPAGLVGPSVLDWLVREGLLITDVDPKGTGPDADDVVRVAFERLGDHLFAARLLSQVKPGEAAKAIESGPLSFAFSTAEAVLENQGLVEALTIQLPEHADFSCELLDVLPSTGPQDAVLRATISALPWRDPEHMTRRTQQIALKALTTNGYGYEVFDNLLAIAAQETGPDAIWLHGSLSRQSMPNRDGFLCGYLHQRVNVSSAVERLLSAPFEIDAADIPEQVCVRWATLLLWFCAAADRRVRDRATKGLVAITQARPKVWVTLIEQFSPVDDEYVVERCFCAAYGTLLRVRDREAESEVARAAYLAVFADPMGMQNALIRDHARCIIELAAHDGVLPDEIELSTVRPPYSSEWPLTIPTEEDLKQYADGRQDYPKLHHSCLDDDFFTYTLNALDRYEEVVPKKAMGRWILNHVVDDLGYGGKALSSYDGYMVYTHGSGRGRPSWAERIGKKYQWIALSRLAARLSDNAKPKKRRSWDPKPKGIPLVYERGRDIDPSLLVRGNQSRVTGPAWWLPIDYDFTAVASLSNDKWATTSDDVPSSEQLLQPILCDGNEWQLLEGYPTWSANRRGDDDDDFKPYRQVWTHIRGYLVKQKSADRVFKWLGQQNFMGRWMEEGAEFHDGFIGEYPWGILFTMYPDRWHGRGGHGDKKPPATLKPVCNSITSSYEEDAFQGGGITVHVPTKLFFEDEPLRWDGLSGYLDKDGRPIFLDPSVSPSGPSALLVNRPYLLDFLQRRQLAVVWTVLGEKLYLGDHNNSAPRLEFSRAHLLDSSGVLRSSDLRLSEG